MNALQRFQGTQESVLSGWPVWIVLPRTHSRRELVDLVERRGSRDNALTELLKVEPLAALRAADSAVIEVEAVDVDARSHARHGRASTGLLSRSPTLFCRFGHVPLER